MASIAQFTGTMLSGLGLAVVLSQQAIVEDGDWRFALAPYAWLSGISGKVATTRPLPTADIEMSIGEVLDNLDGAFFLAGEACKDRFVLLADFVYSNLRTDDLYSGLLFNSVKTRQKNVLIGTIAGYRVVDDVTYKVDLLAGARYWSIDSELTLTNNVVAERRIENTKNWVDPLAGVRLIVPLGERWQIGAISSIGGIISGADLEWDIFANILYRMADWVSVGAEYRHLSVDYNDDGYLYDIDQSDPVLGAALRF
jgi:hypothetical protein